jgi:DNA polymerase
MKPWSPEWKRVALDNLKAEQLECKKCPLLAECRTNVVFGSGNPDADILFVGEGPGEDEDAQGKPFVGRSGKLLNALLATLKVERDEVYTTNLVMCHPPENREPMRTEISSCANRLWDEIYLVDPTVIVSVGKPATEVLSRKTTEMKKMRGRVWTASIPGQMYNVSYPLIPIYHPAYLLRMEGPDKGGKWSPDGPTSMTLEDLRVVIDAVEYVKREYENFRRRL